MAALEASRPARGASMQEHMAAAGAKDPAGAAAALAEEEIEIHHCILKCLGSSFFDNHHHPLRQRETTKNFSLFRWTITIIRWIITIIKTVTRAARALGVDAIFTVRVSGRSGGVGTRR